MGEKFNFHLDVKSCPISDKQFPKKIVSIFILFDTVVRQSFYNEKLKLTNKNSLYFTLNHASSSKQGLHCINFELV